MANVSPRSTVMAFWDQVRLGRSASGAAVAVGVSEKSGQTWFREAGGVKPQVRKPHTSGPRRRLSIEERIEIQVGVGRDESLRSIGLRLGRSASTIKRELDNNVRNRYDGRKSGYRRKYAFGAARAAIPSQRPIRRWPLRNRRISALVAMSRYLGAELELRWAARSVAITDEEWRVLKHGQ